jgi:hypothetical protein
METNERIENFKKARAAMAKNSLYESAYRTSGFIDDVLREYPANDGYLTIKLLDELEAAEDALTDEDKDILRKQGYRI